MVYANIACSTIVVRIGQQTLSGEQQRAPPVLSMDLQRLFHKPNAHSIFLRVFKNDRLYLPSPGVPGERIGVNKLGRSGYPLSPRNHPLIVGITPSGDLRRQEIIVDYFDLVH